MIAKEINQLAEDTLRFSVCTLVTDLAEYQTMLNSFLRAGFKDEFCEFIYVDNSQMNKYDAYAGLNKMIRAASGKYIILCHQDVELNFDNLEVLEERIKEVNVLDQDWAVLSNAGGLRLKKRVEHIQYPDQKEMNVGPFPFQVKSVDENFILIKKEANLSFSHNLKGFHLYGTDLCIIASVLGYNAWVIDFLLLHKSRGNVDESFYKSKEELLLKYRKAYRSRYIRSMCTTVYISGQRILGLTMNTRIVIFLCKLGNKLRRALNPAYFYLLSGVICPALFYL